MTALADHKKYLAGSSIRSALFVVLCMASIWIAGEAGLLTSVDSYLYDLGFRLRGSIPHDRHIVIIAIDEKTLNTLGRWPIRRKYYADLLDRLEHAGCVGFDIIMSEASPDDAGLNSAIDKHSRVVLPIYITNDLFTDAPDRSLFGATVGHIHVEQDVDSIVRSVFHNITYRNHSVPSFSSAMYRILGGRNANGGISNTYEKTSYFSTNTYDKILQNHLMNINFFCCSYSFMSKGTEKPLSPHSFFFRY
ncbi:MAG: CHASE2 domain-containing protein [Deltaproteobacteria bacterium]|nr:CHASE2 domain-containing protein [Deltaproteobacteria bacterium]